MHCLLPPLEKPPPLLKTLPYFRQPSAKALPALSSPGSARPYADAVFSLPHTAAVSPPTPPSLCFLSLKSSLSFSLYSLMLIRPKYLYVLILMHPQYVCIRPKRSSPTTAQNKKPPQPERLCKNWRRCRDSNPGRTCALV